MKSKIILTLLGLVLVGIAIPLLYVIWFVCQLPHGGCSW